MSRPAQSKAQNDANAKTLRSLVKQPDNKVCADCKRNDPRWASWNIGCFLCIRCSGIHRSMGTHISKDLDIWTPEQMESMQKWGNKLCNLYWEAHLKSGHSPPEHKVESFIRSKYESRRWAKDGPPPKDPSTLDSSSAPAPAEVSPAATLSRQPASSAAPPQPRSSNPIDLLSDPSPAAPVTSGKSNLLDEAPPSYTKSAPAASASAAPKAAAAPPKSSGGGGGLFDLDWHEPAGATSPTSPTLAGGAAKGKNDIMSLFASKPTTSPVAQQSASSSGFGDFGSFASPAAPAANTPSGLGGLSSGFGELDLGSGSAASSKPTASASNPWAANTTSAAPASNGLFDTQDVWGPSGGTTQASQPAKTAPKDDAFADIWGDFK